MAVPIRTASNSCPAAWGENFERSVPRTRVGVNEYIYALSKRHPAAVKCAPRRPVLAAPSHTLWPHLHVREPVCTARALPPPHPHALCPSACA